MVHPYNNVSPWITTPRHCNRRSLSIDRHYKQKKTLHCYCKVSLLYPQTKIHKNTKGYKQRCYKPREQVAAKPIPFTSTSETFARDQADFTAAQTACQISVEDCCSDKIMNLRLIISLTNNKSWLSSTWNSYISYPNNYLNTVPILPNLYWATSRS